MAYPYTENVPELTTKLNLPEGWYQIYIGTGITGSPQIAYLETKIKNQTKYKKIDLKGKFKIGLPKWHGIEYDFGRYYLTKPTEVYVRASKDLSSPTLESKGKRGKGKNCKGVGAVLYDYIKIVPVQLPQQLKLRG